MCCFAFIHHRNILNKISLHILKITAFVNKKKSMQIIKSLAKLFVFICPFFADAQATFLPLGDKGYQILERLEIKQQTNLNFNFSATKPFNRRHVTEEVEFLDSIHKASILNSPADTIGKRSRFT